jgi:transcriptional antiterminator RfaH
MMNTSMSPEKWYAIQSKPRQEERAARDLLAWGVEAFLPRIRGSISRRSPSSRRSQPLFTGYLFARFDEARMFGKIKYTRGVARVLGTELGPTPVDESIIALIRARVGADGLVHLSIQPGEQVCITDGPLKGFVGVFSSSLTSRERVEILLTAVHSPIKVIVGRDCIERVV